MLAMMHVSIHEGAQLCMICCSHAQGTHMLTLSRKSARAHTQTHTRKRIHTRTRIHMMHTNNTYTHLSKSLCVRLQSVQASPAQPDALAAASLSDHPSTLQPTPSPSPSSSSPSLPAHSQPPMREDEGHRQEPPHAAQTSTIQRLQMVASSLESFEEDEDLHTFMPPPPAGAASTRSPATGSSGHPSSSGAQGHALASLPGLKAPPTPQVCGVDGAQPPRARLGASCTVSAYAICHSLGPAWRQPGRVLWPEGKGTPWCHSQGQ